MTPAALAAVMAETGKPISIGAIRYHCRDPRGRLHGVARQVGRSWDIDPAAAAAFAASWEPYGTLRKARGRQPPTVAGPDPPSPPRSLPLERTAMNAAQRTVWHVGHQFTWASGGYFGETPTSTLESLGLIVTRIAAALHKQGATEGVLLLDGKAAHMTGMSDPMDGDRHRALDSAASAGWRAGRLGAWTVIHAKDRPTVHVGQIDRLNEAGRQDVRLWPFAEPSWPADVVTALQEWHRLTGVAWQAGAPVMGVELMHKSMTSYVAAGTQKGHRRRPDLRDDSTPDDASVSMWSPGMWHRPIKGRWMHGYDKIRAGITAAGVAKLSPAKLVRGRLRTFDPKRAGWWLIVAPAWNVTEMPHPLGPGAAAAAAGVGGANRLWVTTATMDLAAELAAEGVLSMPEVVDSMTGPARVVLAPWQQTIERAYAAGVAGEYDTTAQNLVRAALKMAGNAGIGMLAKADGKSSIWRPDWYATVNATKQANAWRTAWKIGQTESRWPIAFDDDKVFYASDEADPVKAAPKSFTECQCAGREGSHLTHDVPGAYRAENSVERKRK